MSIEDLYKKFGKPVSQISDNKDDKFMIVTCDTGKRFKIKRNSKEAEYILRDINKEKNVDNNGAFIGTVLKGVNNSNKTARVYIVHEDSKVAFLSLHRGITSFINYDDIPDHHLDIFKYIEDNKDICILTNKSFLGFKNDLTFNLQDPLKKGFYEYVFDYSYLYYSRIEQIRLVNHIKMVMLQPEFLKYEDVSKFIKMNITEQDTIGNMLVDIQTIMGQREISDCSIAVGTHIMLRVDKKLEPLTKYNVVDEKTALLIEDELMAIAPFSKKKEYLETGTTRIAVTHPQWGRYRISLGRQRGSLSISMRLIPKEIRDIKDFRLPRRIQHKLLSKQGGLYLIVGVPNSGKSTLAASIIDTYLKKNQIKICTAERPIEYLFDHGEGLITQHEIGDDVVDYGHIMEMLLTYDPDIVYITETKNAIELKTNIEMAESGKQVITTFHAGSVSDALGRIKGMLEGDKLAISGMASVLKLIIVQQLVPRAGGGVVPVQEIYNIQPSQKQALVEFDTNALTSDLMNQKIGNRLMINDLWNLKEKRIISDKTYNEYVDTELAQSVNFAQYRAEYDVIETEEEIESRKQQSQSARDVNNNLTLKRKGRL